MGARDALVNPLLRSVAVNPVTPQKVYAAGPAGVLRSEDGGLTWTVSGNEITGEPLAVTLDPASPETVFVVAADGSVWKSADGADTWLNADSGQ